LGENLKNAPPNCRLCAALKNRFRALSAMGKKRGAADMDAPSADGSGGDGHKKDPRTVFVRGVAFQVGEKQLEEVFADVGPVKKCFLVRPKGQDKHRG
jgi:RNA recognition motif-containing protein